MTSDLKSPELKERVIALRRAGKSRREIKEITGVTRNQVLSEMLKGVPPEPSTFRPRAKDELHARARQLRAQGRTYNEIAAELGVSKGSVSLWVRDLPRTGRLSYEESRRRNAEAVSRHWKEENRRREGLRQAVSDRAFAEIGNLSKRETVIAGAIAYWCEGSKNKPYSRADRVTFINSDPAMIALFMQFLEVAGVASDRLICRVAIHESADVERAQQFWLLQTGLPEAQFRRPTLKRHNPKTVRKNTGEGYHGCLTINVRCSTELYRQIEGWAGAAMSARNPTFCSSG
jgi:transposase-like protein